MVRAAYVQETGLSPRSCRLKQSSRVGRVTPLWVWGVSAPEKRAALAANAGGTAEGSPFVPILGWKVFFYTKNDLS